MRGAALDPEIEQVLGDFSNENREDAIGLMAYGYWNGWLDCSDKKPDMDVIGMLGDSLTRV